jgi:hypothetical protein
MLSYSIAMLGYSGTVGDGCSGAVCSDILLHSAAIVAIVCRYTIDPYATTSLIR